MARTKKAVQEAALVDVGDEAVTPADAEHRFRTADPELVDHLGAVLRRCIGSKTFGIEPHEAPVDDFPIQPSQKDGLGRLCRPHWTQYT